MSDEHGRCVSPRSFCLEDFRGDIFATFRTSGLDFNLFIELMISGGNFGLYTGVGSRMVLFFAHEE